MTFCFVDRLQVIEKGRRARGELVVPRGVPEVPPCYLAEAIGQLAGWIAMSATGFRRRPVAGIAREVRILGQAPPDCAVDLEAELNSLSDDAVSYGGRASLGGRTLVELGACLGPMLAMEDFDDPEEVRKRYEALAGPLAREGASPDTAYRLDVSIGEHEVGKRICAELRVPVSAPFFADHFPRKPVLPATLLLDAQLEIAYDLASEVLRMDARRMATESRVRDLKLRSFTPPGDILELEAKMVAAGDSQMKIILRARSPMKCISTATLEIDWKNDDGGPSSGS